MSGVAGIRRIQSRRRAGLIASLLVCASLSRSWASTEVASVNVDTITVTATRSESRNFDVPAAVSVLDQTAIENSGASVLPEALQGETGVYVQQTTAGQGAPLVRGLIGSSVLMLVDGMRLNAAFFRPAPNQFYALIDPWQVARLEVTRGPGSALYGSDALGGVINVITRSPEFEDADWQSDWRLIARYASAENAWLAHYRHDTGRSGLALSGGLSVQSLGDRETGSGERSPTGHDVYAANLKLHHTFDGAKLSWNIQYLRQPETPRVDELTPGFGQALPSSSEFSFEPTDRLFFHADYQRNVHSLLAEKFDVHLSYQQINDDRRQRDFQSDLLNLEQNRSDQFGLSVAAFRGIGDGHFLTYGVEAYRDEISSHRATRDILTGSTASSRSRFADGSSMDSIALYVQDQISLTDRVSTILNLRYSLIDVAVPVADRNVGVDQTFDNISGGLSLHYRLSDTFNLVSNIGTGFRAPNVFDLSALGPRPGNRFNTANPDLSPEKLISVDLGIKYRSENLAAEIFVFDSRYKDRIDAQPTGVERADGRFEVQAANISQVKLTGIEAGARWIPATGWKLAANFNWVHTEQTLPEGGQGPASRTPPINVRGSIGKQLAPDWSVEGWIRASEKQDRLSARDLRDSRINPDGTAAWATLNLAADWQVTAGLKLRLAAGNILDEAYREHGSGLDAPGRNLKLTFNYQSSKSR